MSAAHTPGPWLYDARECDDRPRGYVRALDAQQGKAVARVTMVWGPQVADANARLIAAAPALLAALEELAWSDTIDGHPACPVCGGKVADGHIRGHCPVGTALAQARGEG